MATKNGGNPERANGGHDLTPDAIDKALRLYDRIKQADDVKREAVEVPEWGATVWVKTLSADDRDYYEQWLAIERQRAKDEDRDPNIRGIRAKIAVMCVVDEDGSHLFTEADRDWLGQKSAAALDRIFSVADRLSGLTGPAREDARKNSETTPSSGSPSG